MRQFNPNLYPPDGYVFKDRDGTLHRADGWKALEAMVTAYRTRNRQEVGNVWMEIQEQACGKTPGHCSDDVMRAPVPVGVGMDFTKRVMAWLATQAGPKRKGEFKLVDDALAARRASVCLGCPGQMALSQACGACTTSIAGMRKALLDGAESKHQNLHACRLLGEDCQTTVHADLPNTKSTAVPEHCWRKQP